MRVNYLKPMYSNLLVIHRSKLTYQRDCPLLPGLYGCAGF